MEMRVRKGRGDGAWTRPFKEEKHESCQLPLPASPIPALSCLSLALDHSISRSLEISVQGIPALT